jgi:hypothetical protein
MMKTNVHAFLCRYLRTSITIACDEDTTVRMPWFTEARGNLVWETTLVKNSGSHIILTKRRFLLHSWLLSSSSRSFLTLVDRHRMEQSHREATDPDRVTVLAPDMRRIRERQQEEAMQRSLEAEEERKRKVKAERERKHVKSPEEEQWEKLGGEGKKLGIEEDQEDRVVHARAADGRDGGLRGDEERAW